MGLIYSYLLGKSKHPFKNNQIYGGRLNAGVLRNFRRIIKPYVFFGKKGLIVPGTGQALSVNSSDLVPFIEYDSHGQLIFEILLFIENISNGINVRNYLFRTGSMSVGTFGIELFLLSTSKRIYFRSYASGSGTYIFALDFNITNYIPNKRTPIKIIAQVDMIGNKAKLCCNNYILETVCGVYGGTDPTDFFIHGNALSGDTYAGTTNMGIFNIYNDMVYSDEELKTKALSNNISKKESIKYGMLLNI